MTIGQTLRAAACFLALSLSWTAVAEGASLMPLPPAADSFDSGSFHVDSYGKGARSIVFIPGLGSGPWSWSEQIARFSPTYRVYALTLNGFDGRPFTPRTDLVAAFSRDFWTMLAAHKIDRPVVIGHSLGGTLAIALAEQHPERLAGIVALDGLPVFPTVAQQSAAERAATAASFSAPIAAQTKDQLLAYDVRYMQSIGVLDATLVQPAAQREARSEPQAVAAWLAADLAADFRPALPQAKVPLVELMPYAPGGPYTKEQTAAFYTSLLDGAPQVTVVPIDDARHFAMLDAPAAVDTAIAHALDAMLAPAMPATK